MRPQLDAGTSYCFAAKRVRTLPYRPRTTEHTASRRPPPTTRHRTRRLVFHPEPTWQHVPAVGRTVWPPVLDPGLSSPDFVARSPVQRSARRAAEFQASRQTRSASVFGACDDSTPSRRQRQTVSIPGRMANSSPRSPPDRRTSYNHPIVVPSIRGGDPLCH